MASRQQHKTHRQYKRPLLAGQCPMLYETAVTCPYCGERFTSLVDGSAGNQDYFEDCEICCRPISFHTMIDSEGLLSMVQFTREDD